MEKWDASVWTSIPFRIGYSFSVDFEELAQHFDEQGTLETSHCNKAIPLFFLELLVLLGWNNFQVSC